MIGRGLLSSPWLATGPHAPSNTPLTAQEKIEIICTMPPYIGGLFFPVTEEANTRYSTKMAKTLWDCMLPDLQRNGSEKILKSSRLVDYRGSAEIWFTTPQSCRAMIPNRTASFKIYAFSACAFISSRPYVDQYAPSPLFLARRWNDNFPPSIFLFVRVERRRRVNVASGRSSVPVLRKGNKHSNSIAYCRSWISIGSCARMCQSPPISFGRVFVIPLRSYEIFNHSILNAGGAIAARTRKLLNMITGSPKSARIKTPLVIVFSVHSIILHGPGSRRLRIATPLSGAFFCALKSHARLVRSPSCFGWILLFWL